MTMGIDETRDEVAPAGVDFLPGFPLSAEHHPLPVLPLLHGAHGLDLHPYPLSETILLNKHGRLPPIHYRDNLPTINITCISMSVVMPVHVHLSFEIISRCGTNPLPGIPEIVVTTVNKHSFLNALIPHKSSSILS